MYMPLRNSCARMMATTEGSHPSYALGVRSQLAPGVEALGAVHAVSAETGRTLWIYEQRAATMSLVATGGGLVFGGDVNGRFRALDQETGAVLQEINLGSPVTGFPISYAAGGRQYVAVSTGSAATASGFIRLTPELRPSAGNNFFVFAVGDPPHRRGGSSPRSFEHLVRDVPQAREVESIWELRVSLTTGDALARDVDLELLQQRQLQGGLPWERRPRLSHDRLVVVAEDDQGLELDWRLVPNPGIVRAEWPTRDDTLTGSVHVRDTNLLIAIPVLPNIAEIKLYRPQWTGIEFHLELYGNLEFDR